MLRGGLFAALITVRRAGRRPVAVTFVPSPALPRPCRRSSSKATGASKPRPSAPISSPARAAGSARPRSTTGCKALYRDRPVPGRPDQPGRRPDRRHRGRKPGHQPRRFRRQQEGQGRAARRRSAVEAARHAVAADGAVRHPAHHRNLSPQRPLRRARSIPEIIEQPNNRVDLVFEVTEGGKTGVKSIEFVGNSAFSSYRLRDVIKTRETNILSFLGSADIYDPDRVEADRDLIRRFYLKNGYADVQVVAALTEYDPETQGLPRHLQDRGRPAVSRRFGRIQSQHSRPSMPTRCAATRASASARSTTPKRSRNRSRK